MKPTLYSSLVFLSLFVGQAFATDWWTLSDQDFAAKYSKEATSSTIKDQSTVAWMLFARINQPKSNQQQTVSQWQMWPSNDDTFSPAVGLFKVENKVLLRPHLEPPKILKIEGELKGFNFTRPANGGGEEVTRNLDSYNYIVQNGLHTRVGVTKFFSTPGARVDLPVGAIEIKASWALGVTAGAYQFVGKTATYSLLGLHIMAKMEPTPASPFSSENPSWFWTTFEFKGNPGLSNAQSLLTYQDALSTADATNLLTQAGLGQTPFANYKCNGTQIRYSDATHKKITLGNTQMEAFAFTPAKSSPDKWKTWDVSCHTCHGTTAADPKNSSLFFPFSRLQVKEGGGAIPPDQMNGYQSLDFVWSIAEHAR